MESGLTRFDRNAGPAVHPGGLAVLMVGIASRQAASPTARLQTRLNGMSVVQGLLSPRHGAFSLAAAQALTCRKQG